ncbi:hypothetical protein CDQ83_08730 [Clostridium thermosuccinogenes]|nr:hypothetical protein CDQ83_08730 [Pseudoclostridium thermosuccinogenes]
MEKKSMDNVQAQFVELLSCAIRGKKVDERTLGKYDWKELLEYADVHHVIGLVYSALPKSGEFTGADERLLEQFKKETALTIVGQIQHIRQVAYVLGKFKEVNIPVILLKGLVVRGLYPLPELRTMCDADVLVKESDLGKVDELMKNIGYAEGEKSPVHVSYFNKDYNRIEVHWTIEDRRFFNDEYGLEEDMWQRAEKTKIGEIEALSFAPEDLALHLCIHMAVHIITGGFGIRQLCDLVLLVEKKGYSINWQSFCEKMEKWGIEKFVSALFMLCNQLFHMPIPDEIEKNTSRIDMDIVDNLAEDIISGGVYGKKDLPYIFANEMAYDHEGRHAGSTTGVMMRLLKLLFPPWDRLSDQYAYARKYKILLPVAWLHHIISGIRRREYGWNEKIRFLKSVIFISRKRHELLKRLEL